MGCKKISIAVCAYLFGLREGSVAISLLRSEMLVAIPSAAQERGRVRGVRKVREILRDNSQKCVNESASIR